MNRFYRTEDGKVSYSPRKFAMHLIVSSCSSPEGIFTPTIFAALAPQRAREPAGISEMIAGGMDAHGLPDWKAADQESTQARAIRAMERIQWAHPMPRTCWRLSRQMSARFLAESPFLCTKALIPCGSSTRNNLYVNESR